eukprot:31197-Pelagococcus_subviridis.AAC.15
MVALFRTYLSNPPTARMFPAGTSSTLNIPRPIMRYSSSMTISWHAPSSGADGSYDSLMTYATSPTFNVPE